MFCNFSNLKISLNKIYIRNKNYLIIISNNLVMNMGWYKIALVNYKAYRGEWYCFSKLPIKLLLRRIV